MLALGGLNWAPLFRRLDRRMCLIRPLRFATRDRSVVIVGKGRSVGASVGKCKAARARALLDSTRLRPELVRLRQWKF
jgi:hypothetical protein